MGQPEMTETSRACWEAEILYQLDTYGAPPGDTIEDRLRAWEQRERALRVAFETLSEITDAADRGEYNRRMRP